MICAGQGCSREYLESGASHVLDCCPARWEAAPNGVGSSIQPVAMRGPWGWRLRSGCEAEAGEYLVFSLTVLTDNKVGRLDLAKLLLAVENAPPVAAADVLGEWLAEALDASEVSFLVVDFSGRALIRLGHAGVHAGARTLGRETAERVPLDGSAHGQALRSQAVEVELLKGEARLLAPVTNRGGAIGMLELRLPDPPDERTLADVALLAAHALAYVIIANRRFTELYAWGQRSVRLSLAAEIQHRLLPAAFTCEGGAVHAGSVA